MMNAMKKIMEKLKPCQLCGGTGGRTMRLIDADGMPEGRVENDPVVIAAKCAPTAYDPDRVVEQLEEACISLSDYPGYTVDIEKAIEIVKGGGIDG